MKTKKGPHRLVHKSCKIEKYGNERERENEFEIESNTIQHVQQRRQGIPAMFMVEEGRSFFCVLHPKWNQIIFRSFFLARFWNAVAIFENSNWDAPRERERELSIETKIAL